MAMKREDEKNRYAAKVGLKVRDVAIIEGLDIESAERMSALVRTSVVKGIEWADEHPKEKATKIDNIISILKIIDYRSYISSLTSGVGVINFNVDKFIEDLKNTISNK